MYVIKGVVASRRQVQTLNPQLPMEKLRLLLCLLREYFKDKVGIYCQNLPQGDYTYTINLEPDLRGNTL